MWIRYDQMQKDTKRYVIWTYMDDMDGFSFAGVLE